VTIELMPPVARVTSRARGTGLVILASVCFGTSGPLAKPIMDAGLGPQQTVGLRIGLAALIMLVVVALTRPTVLRLTRSDWPVVAAYGLVGVAVVQLLYFAAVARIPIGTAVLLEFTSPVLVALWVRFVRGTLLPAKAWVGTALALTGLFMVVKVWEGFAFDALGLLFGSCAALAGAGYFLLGERAIGTVEPLGLVTWGLVIGSVTLFVAVPPWTIPAGILDDGAAFGPWHPPVWTLVLGLAVLSTALAYLLSISAMRHLPSNVVSVLALVEPVVSVAVAWAFLGQTLTAVQVLGACVLLGGATLVQISATQPSSNESATVRAPNP
jgi:threonine/homoserine efflux transporter RhtA